MVKYYAVQKGRETGVYTTWSECQAVVNRVPGAVYKSFTSHDEARSFVNSNAGYGPRTTRITLPRTSSDRSYDSSSSSSSDYDHPRPIPISQSYCEDYEVAYTDGAVRGNGRPHARGGWGVYYSKGDPRNACGHIPSSQSPTNQIAELTAINRCLDKAISYTKTGRASQPLKIKTDSEYSVNCLTKWANKWENNSWRTSQGTSVSNQELIKSALSKMRTLEDMYGEVGIHGAPAIEYVPGHSTSVGNQAADRLATCAADETY